MSKYRSITFFSLVLDNFDLFLLLIRIRKIGHLHINDYPDHLLLLFSIDIATIRAIRIKHDHVQEGHGRTYSKVHNKVRIVDPQQKKYFPEKLSI